MSKISGRPLLGIGMGMATVFVAFACGTTPKTTGGGAPLATANDGGAPPTPTMAARSSTQIALAAMTPARAAAPADSQKRLSAAIDQFFQRTASGRLYVHLDKPLYQPGEIMWFRAWELATPTMMGRGDGYGLTAQLISPKGATVLQKRIMVTANVAANDFELPEDVQGGEYIVRVTSDHGTSFDRKVIVSQYQPPQIKKKLEFLRKAYGAGDEVSAALSLHRGTGEALAGKAATGIVTVDDVEVQRLKLTMSPTGSTTVRFALPKNIARGDGLLTILVEEGGVTESIQKRIPITMKELDIALYPEGGDLVTGLPSRVYFQAKNMIGKAADIDGRIVDESGAQVASFSSFHNGLGHFEVTPQGGKSYFLEVLKPVGITAKVPLPTSQAEGCTMQSVDDPLGESDDLRIGVWCTKDRSIVSTAVLRERRLGDASYEVKVGEPTLISIPVPVGSQGAVRVTLFDDQLNPMAERLVYRGRGADLAVTLKAERATYAPRDQVALTVETRDLAGKPVQADLSLAVVDDTVLSFADDKSAHLLARLYLESEMPGQEIEEPNFYFDRKEAKSAAAIDLVLGTQGWRRFDWQPVLAPPPPPVATRSGANWDREEAAMEGAMVPMAAPADQPMPAPPIGGMKAPRAPAKKQAPARPKGAEGKMGKVGGKGMAAKAEMKPKQDFAVAVGRGAIARDKRMDLAEREMAAGEAMIDDEWDGDEMAGGDWNWAPVRQFPVPNYEGRYDGPRTDFRETIFFAPSVKTDKSGTATVKFPVSDAITSFRATAEGISAGGLVGRGEGLIQSKLPVSLAVTMPLEATKGDRIQLPVSLANETDRAYDVTVTTQFGKAFKVAGGVPASIKLKAGERKAFFAELEVVGDGKQADDGLATIAINTSNLKDEVSRTIRVVPLGFPQEVSAAGTVEKTAKHEVDLSTALPGSITASLTMYPSPLATMVKGTEAIIREPSGCFEQASSSNYPNIMVLDYMLENDAADPALIEKTSGMLDRGYKKIAGYESPEKGYEWFGGDPGHEALTAYGLMEFADMTKVYDDVDRQMIERTKAWLKKRRDGKGGYERNSRALDSFGSASPEVTNGYITYALSETGENDKTMKTEIDLQRKMAKETTDPYIMAMATNTLINVAPGAADTKAAVARLRTMQKAGGVFSGASHSITRSGGSALDIETTALATLALVKAGEAQTQPARDAIEWLNANRGGFGNFSSTQATVLALKAMTGYANASRATQSGGVAKLFINGKAAGEFRFAKGHKDPIVFDDLAASLKAGKNTIELKLDAENPLPYSLAIEYRAKQPASSPETAVALSTTLAKDKVPMGEGVKMKVSVKNLKDEGIPMTLARVGLPGGLTFQTWQLKELKDKGLIDFYETREREVVLYFRSMAPKASKDLDLDLIARVPGEYVAPASRAYLYYTDEYKHWVAPTKVTVTK